MQTTVHDSFPPAETLMRKVLRKGGPIAAEYPLIFGGEAPGRLVSAHEELDGERELRAACAILVRELVTPAARLRVGLIGSVVTDAGHRARGWGRNVLAQAEQTLRAEGCAFSLLWADSAGFYERQGYRAIGTELNYLVDPCVSTLLPSMQRVRDARPEDYPALHAIYSQKAERVERTLEEMSALLGVPGMELLVRESEEGEAAVAYSCVGRGQDFPSVVHEWGGRGEDVLSLLQTHLQRRAEIGDRDPLVMLVPWDDNVRNFFDVIEAPHVSGVLGMAKLLDVEALAAPLAELVGEHVTVATTADGDIVLTGPGGTATIASADVLATLVEPKGARARIARLEESLGTQLSALPLRPFVWGLDSI